MSERNVDEDDYVRDEYDANPSERGKWVSVLVALLGLWVVIGAVMGDLAAVQFWSDVIVGGLLILVGGYNAYRRSQERTGSTAAAVVTVIGGLWLVATPFMFDAGPGIVEATSRFGFWNDVVVGLLVALLGAYSAYEAREPGAGVARPAER